MSDVLAAIEHFGRTTPNRMALSGAGLSLTYGDLPAAIDAAAAALSRVLPPSGPIAVALDNGPDWVLTDLALIRLGRVSLPLPTFFSSAQTAAAVADCGASAVLSKAAEIGAGSIPVVTPYLSRLAVAPTTSPAVPLHSGTSKITYTSGSTGAPKGLCLAQREMEAVAQSLLRVLGEAYTGVHMPVLPLGVLLENIAGLYSTFLAGSHYRAVDAAATGLSRPFAPDWAVLVRRLAVEHATSTILVPELLRGLVTALEKTGARLPDLRLVAVGGARIAEEVLERAAAVGLPVAQGYGLTEAASVVSLNTPADNGIGSVGRVLPHLKVAIDDGEIVIDGIAGLGYVGRPPLARRYRTGDLGSFDAQGRLHVTGRKDNLIVTSFGRNIAPEWIESELTAEPAIGQAIVVGSGKPHLAALLVPSSASSDAAALSHAIDSVNRRLPDYAHIRHWTITMPFSVRGGLLTPNGRPRRAEIHQRYRQLIDRCSEQDGRLVRFFDRLAAETTAERANLFTVPQIRDGLAGRISRAAYLAYLGQAYHHVRHTVPLFEFARARLAQDQAWVREAFDEYIDEERGHDQWILDDIRHAGGDADLAAASAPFAATQRMIDEAYTFIDTVNPLGLFGMVFVLEGTSTQLASKGASAVAASLGLGPECFSYLSSHGALDLDHLAHFQLLMDRVENAADQAAIIAMAKRMFVLFADMFAAIPHPEAQKNVA